jgi:DNA-binding GntR family transcriptional regulator
MPKTPPTRRSSTESKHTHSASKRAGAASTKDTTTRRIAQAITTAIIERRLLPGTKLSEQRIADVFQVSRTLVRQALLQLSRDHLVTLAPARGARVAEPSITEAKQVFAVRRLLETALIKEAASALTPVQIDQLKAHLHEQHEAVMRIDVPGRTRLLADFHVVLARMLGNEVLADILNDLVSRSSLISLMYQSAHSAEQSYAEHVAIVDALERRDARGAVRLMQAHLNHVERSNWRLDPRQPDLHSVFSMDPLVQRKL